ncbi:uncharacterized protein LOC105427466 [Pogonomyrmex barbatus]|uniref:Uncharacterized protein LOC105427466 n=1 Tax=Pogonomyrmex barbatus TaxID=144034 RepID=A0A6I9WZP3_9HYME|nr:uncharacterized protein LOC105427466 [Pogonomyrmex barbatus]
MHPCENLIAANNLDNATLRGVLRGYKLDSNQASRHWRKPSMCLRSSCRAFSVEQEQERPTSRQQRQKQRRQQRRRRKGRRQKRERNKRPKESPIISPVVLE